MKRYAAIFLCLWLLASLAGCHAPEPPAESTAPIGTTLPGETTLPTEPEVPAKPSLTAISLPQIFHYTTDQYMTLMTYSYFTPSFLHGNSEAGSAIVRDLQKRVDATASSAEEILDLADATYAATGEATNYFYEMRCDIKRMDPSVLSMQILYGTYEGGMRPTHFTDLVTYDLNTGNVLTLSEIISGDISSVSQLLLDVLSGMEGLYTFYENTIGDMFSQETEPANWYLSDTGLCFLFNPYEIAPYVAGTISAQIPYSSLNGVLKEDFFPAEKEDADGVLNAILYSDADLSGFDRYAELITDPEGTEILLYPSGNVTDFRIDQGRWDYDGVAFYPQSTVFASPQLWEGDAVKVTTMVPEIMPDLRIQYTSGGETVTKYLLLSGMDGSALLID